MNVIMCICGCCVALIIGVSAIVITGIICHHRFKVKKEEHCHELIKMDKINEYRKGENNENQEKNNNQQ